MTTTTTTTIHSSVAASGWTAFDGLFWLLFALGVTIYVTLFLLVGRFILEFFRSPRIGIRELMLAVVVVALSAMVAGEMTSFAGKALCMAALLGLFVLVCAIGSLRGAKRIGAKGQADELRRWRVWRIYRRARPDQTLANSGTSASASNARSTSFRVSSQPVQASVIETP
jgi:hypothetical protein